MFERFTAKARSSVVAAQEEARRLGHGYIGTEHLLLGLLSEPESIGARALAQLGIGVESGRAAVEGLVGSGEGAPNGHIPFTSRAKKTLELSLREALALGHNYIGTEHILLGLAREGDGVAAQILTEQGATPERIRAMVTSLLGAPPSLVAGSTQQRRTAGAEAVMSTAAELAGSSALASQHLLEAISLVEDSLGSRVLHSFGVTAQGIATRIDDFGTEGTSDASPEDLAASRMELRVDGDEVTIVLRDAATVELVKDLVGRTGNPLSGNDAGTSPLTGLWQANRDALQQLSARVIPASGDASTAGSGVRDALRQRLSRRRS